MMIIATIIQVYQFMLFIRFIMQWIDTIDINSVHPAFKSIITTLKSVNGTLIPITEPVLAPIRDKVTFNHIDLSPLVVSVILSIVAGVLTSIFSF
jgi:hypothetical protein